jgi:hypothetical protein
MILRTTRRPGVTLMEVLIATGILAIGMLAIMALFPIGAVSMARAINQNRAADQAAASDAMFRFYWKKAWLDPNGNIRALRRPPLDLTSPLGTYAVENEPMIKYLDEYPGSPVPPNQPAIASTSPQPSLFVLVDPIGFHTQTGQSQNYVAGLNTFPTRTSLAAAEADPLPRTRIRLTTLLDDLSWDISGEPSAQAGQLDRGGRYNVAWLIQRPKNNVPHEVRMFVMVYGGRSPTDTPSLESLYPGAVSNYMPNFDPKPNTITVQNVQSMPNIRRGSWVGMSMLVMPQWTPPAPQPTPYQVLDFYRVAGITDDISNTQTITLELEEPLRTYDVSTLVPLAGYNNATGNFVCSVIFFDNLLEVFDRGIVSAQGISGR